MNNQTGVYAMRKILLSTTVTQEVADIAKTFQTLQQLFQRASQLPTPQVAEPIELDAANSGQRRFKKEN